MPARKSQRLYLRLTPEQQLAPEQQALVDETRRLIEAEATQAGKARQICDWLAGLTDGMIVRTYRRLFDAEPSTPIGSTPPDRNRGHDPDRQRWRR